MAFYLFSFGFDWLNLEPKRFNKLLITNNLT